MKSKQSTNNAEYYKKRIEDFSKYNQTEVDEFFKSIKYGTMVMAYPSSFEKEINKYVAAILQRDYPKYCNEDNIVEILSSYGHIYTAKIGKNLGCGLYHINSANILIYSFLNKLNEAVVHELIHKLGYLQFNEDFYNMSKIYVEAGTEQMTNSVLEKPLCRELLLGNLWTRSVGIQPRYLIETFLVNQLNVACGNDSLERSILHGRNYIEPSIKNLIGEEKYLLLFTKLTDICRLEKSYWNSKKRDSKEKEIYERICDFQDDILQEIWKKRISEVKDKDEAEKILNDLMKFSDYRVKENEETKKDEAFNSFFKSQQQLLEDRFGTTFDINDITDTWKQRYPIIMLEETELEKEKNEKSKIDALAEQRQPKSKGLFSRLLNRKINYDKKLLVKNFKIDTSEIDISEFEKEYYVKNVRTDRMPTDQNENNKKEIIREPEK